MWMSRMPVPDSFLLYVRNSREVSSCNVQGCEEIEVTERRVCPMLQQESGAAGMFRAHGMVEGCLPKEILKSERKEEGKGTNNNTGQKSSNFFFGE